MDRILAITCMLSHRRCIRAASGLARDPEAQTGLPSVPLIPVGNSCYSISDGRS